MKKLLLFLTVLLVMADTSLAQDVWTLVRKRSMNNAVLYRNNEDVLEISNCIPKNVLDINGHTYFAYYDDSAEVGVVYDFTTSTTVFQTESDAETRIEEFFPGENGVDIYAVGYKRTSSIGIRAAMWKGGTAEFCGDSPSSGLCGCVGKDGNIYVGGYEYYYLPNGDLCYSGKIWYAGNELYSFPQEWSEVKDIAFYDGNVYSVLYTRHGCYVYKNDEILYDLNGEDYRAYFEKIVIDGGDIYMCGSCDGNRVVWKNGMVLYSSATNSSMSGWDLVNVWVNSNDIYFEGQNNDRFCCTKVWKNGEELFVFYVYGESNIEPTGMCVEPLVCENTAPRSLPYFEGFEMGETDWECWTKKDEDGDNNGRASYWDRGGRCGGLNTREPHTGDHVAIHRDCTYGFPQDGWLISPRLALQSNREVTLSFYSYNEYATSYDFGYEGVWVSTNGDPHNLGSYTELWHPSNVTPSWEEVTVDLSDYAGQNVYIAFKYMGDEAQEWLIDDIVVSEGLAQYTVAVESSNTAWGTVSGGGTFDEGTNITIHATPQSGHVFLKWTKDGTEVSTNANYSFRVDASTSGSYTAWFGEPSVTYYTITAVPNDPSLGTVRGGGAFAAGSETILWAVASGSNTFSRWDDGNTENPRKVVMNSDITLKAFFKSTGVDENDITAMSLYPNPARETLRIKGLEANSELLFYNTLGMMVKRATAGADEEISVSDLAPGLYLIRCNSQTIRFVKK